MAKTKDIVAAVVTPAEAAALEAVMAEMTAGFEQALKDALAPFIVAVTELEQRSSNFAARVNASQKIMRAEITSLREQVAALTPKAKVCAPQRVAPADWDWAMAQLKAEHPGKTFFAPGLVRATAEARAYRTESATVGEPVDADEEVCL